MQDRLYMKLATIWQNFQDNVAEMDRNLEANSTWRDCDLIVKTNPHNFE